MPIQRSLRIRRTHSFDALRCAESSKRLLKISVVCLIPMFRRPPVIVVFAPSTLRTLNEVNFKQHDKREVIGTKVNGSPCSTESFRQATISFIRSLSYFACSRSVGGAHATRNIREFSNIALSAGQANEL
jgi:hypothetical protein